MAKHYGRSYITPKRTCNRHSKRLSSCAPNGENLRYVLTNTTSGYMLSQWNSSKTIPLISAGSNPSSTQINAATSNRYDHNATIAAKFTTAPTIRAGVVDDYIWGSNGSWPTGTSGPSYAYPAEVTIWKISVADATFGNVTYMKNIAIDDATTNQNEMFERASGSEHRFVTIEVPSCTFRIYNII